MPSYTVKTHSTSNIYTPQCAHNLLISPQLCHCIMSAVLIIIGAVLINMTKFSMLIWWVLI